MIAPILGAAIASGLQLHTQVVQTMQHEVYTLFYKYVVNDGSDFEICPHRNIEFFLFINFLLNPRNFTFICLKHLLSFSSKLID